MKGPLADPDGVGGGVGAPNAEVAGPNYVLGLPKPVSILVAIYWNAIFDVLEVQNCKIFLRIPKSHRNWMFSSLMFIFFSKVNLGSSKK